MYFAFGATFYFENDDFKASRELGNKIRPTACRIDFPNLGQQHIIILKTLIIGKVFATIHSSYFYRQKTVET